MTEENNYVTLLIFFISFSFTNRIVKNGQYMQENQKKKEKKKLKNNIVIVPNDTKNNYENNFLGKKN